MERSGWEEREDLFLDVCPIFQELLYFCYSAFFSGFYYFTHQLLNKLYVCVPIFIFLSLSLSLLLTIYFYVPLTVWISLAMVLLSSPIFHQSFSIYQSLLFIIQILGSFSLSLFVTLFFNLFPHFILLNLFLIRESVNFPFSFFHLIFIIHLSIFFVMPLVPHLLLALYQSA